MYPNSAMTRTRGPARESVSLVPIVMYESNAVAPDRPARGERDEGEPVSGVQDGVEVEGGAQARLEGAGAELLLDAPGQGRGGLRLPVRHEDGLGLEAARSKPA